MKIAKYIFLLLALFSIAFSVFVATQPGSFEVVKEKKIDSSKILIFDFISNLENLPNWLPYDFSNQNVAFKTNEANTITNASWKSKDSEFQFSNETLFDTDSIYQNFTENKKIQQFTWTLNEQNDSTKITVKLKGNLSFQQKLKVLYHGGTINIFGPQLETALANIEKKLNDSFVEHSITIQGFSYQKGINFIQYKDSCSIKDFDVRSKEILKKVSQFVEQNGIKPTGNPFVLFNRWEENKNFVVYAFCIPIEEEIVSTTNPNITGGNFDNYLALKTKLIGNPILHRKKTYDAAFAYIAKNKYEEDYGGYYLEIYHQSDNKKMIHPMTEIIIPVKKKMEIQTVQDSITTQNETESAE